MKKNVIRILSLVLTLGLSIGVLAACGSVPTAAEENLTYVSLRINPEIEMVVDENNTVVAVNAINEDGDVVLADLELEGKSAEEAAEAFTDKAVELGYLDPGSEDATVYINVDGENVEISVKIKKNLTDQIHHYFDNHGIFGKVSSETYEKYAEQAEAWGVSVGEAKMILRILDMYPEMTPEEVLALTVKERIALIRDNCKNNGDIPAAIRDDCKEKIEEVKEKYGDMFTLAEEIAALRVELADPELTEQERAAKEAELAEKEAEFKELHDTYLAECKQAKEDLCRAAEEIKEQIKEQWKEQKQSCEQKIKDHKEQFEKNKDEIREKIRNWRGGFVTGQPDDPTDTAQPAETTEPTATSAKTKANGKRV